MILYSLKKVEEMKSGKGLKNGLAVRDCMQVHYSTHVLYMFYIFVRLRAQMAMTKSIGVVGEVPVTITGEGIILSHFIQV